MYNHNESNFAPNEVIEYLRKSRSDDPNLSVEEVLAKHEHLLNEYSLEHFGAVIPEKHIYREIASSETISGRPEMIKLLNAIENPKIKAVLVVEVQRLSRGDLEDAGRLIKLFRYTNTQIITPLKTYDLKDEWDRDIFERELKRGNEYLEYFKKIQGRGRLLSVQEGNYIGSIPPYGYDKIFVKVGKKKCPTLAINEEQAVVVRLMFDLFVNKNYGPQRIANHLDELGIKPVGGKEHWSPYAIRDMLANYHYIGKVVWNKRKTKRIVNEQQVISTRPRSEDVLIYDGKHEAIIDEDIFRAAIEKRGSLQRTKSSFGLSNPFASILHCECGRAMSLRQDGKGLFRLSCDDQRHCNNGSVVLMEFQNQICNVLSEHVQDFELKLQCTNNDECKLQQALIKQLEHQLAEVEIKEIKQWEKYSVDGMPKAIFDKLNEQVKKDKVNVEQALKKAKRDCPTPINYQQRIVSFKEALNALRDVNTPSELKNAFLKAIITDIVYTRPKPKRLSKKECTDNKAAPVQLAKHGGWVSKPYTLDIHFKF